MDDAGNGADEQETPVLRLGRVVCALAVAGKPEHAEVRRVAYPCDVDGDGLGGWLAGGVGVRLGGDGLVKGAVMADVVDACVGDDNVDGAVWREARGFLEEVHLRFPGGDVTVDEVVRGIGVTRTE